jgi:drug/metabolite transporter (DMT)-like permease
LGLLRALIGLPSLCRFAASAAFDQTFNVALTPATRAQLQIHFCVMLWGFTAILGKLITLTALPLVWWRMLLVTVALALVPAVWRSLRKMRARQVWIYAGIGALVALHWLTFYGSIKLSNASVGATCMALGPVFLAFIEPWIARRPFSRGELALGVAVLPGVALVVGGVPVEMRAGIAMGALSAFIVAFFSALNKRYVEDGEPLTVTAIELGAGTLTLTLLAPLLLLAFPLPAEGGLIPDGKDFAFLLALSLGCTLLPFTLSLVALRHMSAFSAQMAINLEPVYAILLAMLLFNEQRELDLSFYGGVAILLLAVFAQPLLRQPRTPAHAENAAVGEAKDIG